MRTHSFTTWNGPRWHLTVTACTHCTRLWSQRCGIIAVWYKTSFHLCLNPTSCRVIFVWSMEIHRSGSSSKTLNPTQQIALLALWCFNWRLQLAAFSCFPPIIHASQSQAVCQQTSNILSYSCRRTLELLQPEISHYYAADGLVTMQSFLYCRGLLRCTGTSCLYISKDLAQRVSRVSTGKVQSKC